MLVGCGNIGRRHLQAMARIDRPIDIVVIEPNVAEWAKAREAVAQVEGGDAHRLEFLAALPAEPLAADLAVLATGAEVRRALFDRLEAEHSVGAYIFEKVLFQTTADLRDVEERLAATGKNAWVNCGRRGFPGYAALRDELAGAARVDMRVTGSGWGLCSNGVHFLDLYALLTDFEIVSGSGADLDPGSVASKRAGNVELTGRMTFHGTGGSVELVCVSMDPAPLTVEISTPQMRWVVDEARRTLTRIGADGEARTEPFATFFVSEMPFLYAEVLSEGTCRLTPYSLSARQHQLFIDVVRRHLGLAIDEDQRCPIT